MTHDVIDNVARLIFLLYASFRHYFLYRCQVQAKWSEGSYPGQITTFQLTAATSSKIVYNFLRFNLWIFWYGEHISTFWCWENVIHSVSQESMIQLYKSFMRNITRSQITCFWTSTFKQCILTINQYKGWSFDRICTVVLRKQNFDRQVHIGKISKIKVLRFHWFRV